MRVCLSVTDILAASSQKETCASVFFPGLPPESCASTRLGGVMFRFRYKGSDKMGTRRDVKPAARAVLLSRRLE